MILVSFTLNREFGKISLEVPAVGKERETMLKAIKSQDNLIMMFFVVALMVAGGYVFFDRSVIDVVYLGVLIYYFIRFLIIRHSGK